MPNRTEDKGNNQESAASRSVFAPPAVSRPNDPIHANVSLYAFKAKLSGGSTTLTTLFQAIAGTWANLGGNEKIVPVVANGRVYVASYRQLTIFGLH